MSNLRTDLPSVKAPNFEQRIREVLMTYLGRQGNPLDRGLTLRDLVESGFAKLPASWKPGGGGSVPLVPGDAVQQGEEPDLTPPPTPTGFVVTGAISHVFVEHDNPVFLQGNGYLRTHVYAAKVTAGPLPVFADAVEVGQFSGAVWAMPSDPATTWRLWIKWETNDGVLSVSPAGGTNGLEATTGQDVALLLEALDGQITESQLYADLGARIDLIDGPASLDGSVSFRVAAEAQARMDAVAEESSTRNNQIAIESRQRLDQAHQAGEAVLAAVIASNNERVERLADVATARHELRADFTTGLLAEASARLELTAAVDRNAADILSEQTARSTADDALASDIGALVAQVGNNTAAIAQESAARASADSAEAAQRLLLAAQFRGSYTGNDLNQLTQGLLYQERIARSTQDNALAQQITLLSAGAGEQFDWKSIWYFDAGLEGWTGNGTPTVNQGWLRPADRASGAFVESSAGIGADGNKYGQVRLRIRKVGSPVFGGFLWWRTAADAAWDVQRRVALDEPAFDANGIGLITVSPSWTVEIDRIRVDLSSAQAATAYFEVDWIAIGRPSPGASSAQLLEEQEARANADAAEAAERKTLSSVIVGVEDPTGLTVDGLSAGLLFEERQARSTQDAAIASSVTSLQAALETQLSSISSAITSEESARTTADTAEANARKSLASAITGFEDPTGKTLADLSSGLVFQEQTARASADSALSESITGLNATVGGLSADMLSVQQTVADLDSATASSVTTLVAADRRNAIGADLAAQAALRDAIAVDRERSTRESTLAVARQELTTRIDDGLLAEASARLQLAAELFTAESSLSAAIQNEATARANADSANATAIQQVQARLDTGDYAAVKTESSVNASKVTGLEAKYTVKVDLNGYVSGFGLASTANNATPTSEFAIRADKFYIASPSGPGIAPAMPFIVQTTATTIGGVSVPAGVYMADAFIRNGTITNAKIADAAIDNAKIANLSASKITAGFISADRIQAGSLDAKLLNVDAAAITYGYINVARIADGTISNAKIGNVIQSNDFASGSSGWRIDKTGQMEMNNAVFRGTIDVKSAASGARLQIANNVIRVYDAGGTLRVKIGDLSA